MGKFIDLTGKKYNRLTVVKRVETPKHIKGCRVYWLCKCDCGKEKIILGYHLTTGKIKSCGCYWEETKSQGLIDLTGERFGKLHVIKRIETPRNIKRMASYWLCKCDCGNKKVIWGENLKHGVTISCGCYKKEQKRKSYGGATRRKRYTAYKHDAKRRNLIFSLSEERFFELTAKNCFYCGSEPSTIEKSKSNNGDFIYNGIDRINSENGYIEGNIVPCCTMCNKAKGRIPIDDFYNWINKVYQHNNKKGIFI